jgi:phosphoribosylglycinamide formyltransferase-1
MSLVVLISGRGSNMRALVEAGLPVSAVISNRADAAGLTYAAGQGIATHVVAHSDFASRELFDTALAAQIDQYAPRVVALAGFMRILTPAFVARYAHRLVNIHPSLLPAFTGLDTHARALAAGVCVHGCTVHLVTAALDHGPIIAQAAVAVRRDDTPERLAERVLVQEHRIFPQAVRWLLESRVRVQDEQVHVRDANVSAQALCVPDVE